MVWAVLARLGLLWRDLREGAVETGAEKPVYASAAMARLGVRRESSRVRCAQKARAEKLDHACVMGMGSERTNSQAE